jgi:hypothetical protein
MSGQTAFTGQFDAEAPQTIRVKKWKAADVSAIQMDQVQRALMHWEVDGARNELREFRDCVSAGQSSFQGDPVVPIEEYLDKVKADGDAITAARLETIIYPLSRNTLTLTYAPDGGIWWIQATQFDPAGDPFRSTYKPIGWPECFHV